MTIPTRIFARGCAVAISLSAMQAAHADTLDRVKRQHMAVIGYTVRQFPFSYPGPDGKPAGFAVELCRRILERMHGGAPDQLHIKYVPVDLGNRITMVANGTVDMLCGLSTDNAVREAQVAFLTPIFADATRIFVRDDSSIKSLTDLRGRKLVATTGSSNLQIAGTLNKERGLNMTVMPVKDWTQGIELLRSGRADGFILAETFIRSHWAKDGAQGCRMLPEVFERRTRSIMVRQDEPAFLEAANAALRAMARSGEFEEIYRRWLESPIPPDGANMKMPMDESIKAWIAQTKATR